MTVFIELKDITILVWSHYQIVLKSAGNTMYCSHALQRLEADYTFVAFATFVALICISCAAIATKFFRLVAGIGIRIYSTSDHEEFCLGKCHRQILWKIFDCLHF